MQLLELTLDRPEQNIALDEALLNEAECGDSLAGERAASREVLRIWEPPSPLVVVGRSSRVADEVNRDACRADGVPIFRRASGGAAIVAGPGCLMYAVVLNSPQRGVHRVVDETHRLVLDATCRQLQARQLAVRRQGISDLVLGELKFSGNSLRCRRQHVLYHGTMLYGFALEMISRYLKSPPRQPAYRLGRSHAEFVTNLPIDRETLRGALVAAWQADEPRRDWPQEETRRLVAEKYGRSDWNFRT